MDAALEARIAVFHEMMPPIGDDISAHDFHVATERLRARLEQMTKPEFADVIPDRDFLETIDCLTPIRSNGIDSLWTTFFELRDVFGLPEDVLRIKAKELLDRDLIYGCDCGCRGDLSLDCDGSLVRPTVDELLAKSKPSGPDAPQWMGEYVSGLKRTMPGD